MPAYTIFSQTGSGPLAAADNNGYCFSMQFTVSQNVSLTGIWWQSPASAAALPVACAILQETAPGSGSTVAGTLNSSPSWSGAAGSGWVKCTYNGAVTLSPGTTYRVAIYGAPVTGWYGGTNSYWTSGPGGSGLSNGPLSAPNNAGADVGQDGFAANPGAIAYPNSSNGGNYWVDVEVTTAAAVVYSMRMMP